MADNPGARDDRGAFAPSGETRPRVGTESEKTHAQRKPQQDRKHPEPYAEDLEPAHMAGQNVGERAEDVHPGVRPAAEIKEVVGALRDFDQEELREIPVLPEGARLEQGATYVDLANPRREPFTATAEMEAGRGAWLVPKKEVPHPYWNRLVGAEPPERRE